MRFHPNNRASTDQAPGPRTAKAPARVPSRMLVDGSPWPDIAFHPSRTVTSIPAIGVHKPASRRVPPAIPITAGAACPMEAPARRMKNPWVTRTLPATSRMNKRPAPGQPSAKVENRRRKGTPARGYPTSACEPSPERTGPEPLFRVAIRSLLSKTLTGVPWRVWRTRPMRESSAPPPCRNRARSRGSGSP